jgi:hypothetical protein
MYVPITNYHGKISPFQAAKIDRDDTTTGE